MNGPTLLLSAACSLIGLPAIQPPAPDNTRSIRADRAKGAVTVDQQKRDCRGSRSAKTSIAAKAVEIAGAAAVINEITVTSAHAPKKSKG